ncbi:laminin G domain-containing protein [Phthorimaea operculella]|nr:laminin G domain-containing protein [Phthorimaea operculella]
MGILQVKNQGFDGCLRTIQLGNEPVDLMDYTESIGVSYGCQFASLVSLTGDNSYLRFVNITTENLQLTLKFKTATPAKSDGLIFVYVSRTQTPGAPSISLSLVKGRLVLASGHDKLETLGTYNDSQWHVVTVTHNNNLLRMVIDDYDSVSNDVAPEPLHILDGVLFVGGVQPSYVISSYMATREPFQGCIADATINGRVLNLLQPYTNSSVTFGRCGDTTTSGGPSPGADVVWSPNQASNQDVLPTPSTEEKPVEYPARGDVEQTEPPAQPETTQTPWRPQEQPTTPVAVVTDTPRVTVAAPQPEQGCALAYDTNYEVGDPEEGYRFDTPRVTVAAPQPEQGCALAYDTNYEVGDPEEGYRFGTRNDSHITYAKLPGRQTEPYDLTITFRTFDQHGGLMFYAASDAEPSQFLAVYMKDARVHFSFNCGGETSTLVSPSSYNGTEWHTATVVRHGGHGKLTVDSEHVGDASVSCDRPSRLTPPFYYGGLRNITETISYNLQGFYQPFKGCLKGLRMNGQPVTEVLERVNSLRCIDNVEAGAYFGPSSNQHSNYLKIQENYKVGFEISISMEIKPRNSTGLLLSVHGKKDFMVIELLENEVVANVENGKGPFSASYKLGNKFSLCDGNWHRIHAVKSRHVVSVGVDGHFSDAGLGQSGSTDTRSALYIGGHERPISRVRGVRSRRGFTGCIRNIMIRESLVQIPLTAAGRNTHIGVCPAD